MYDKVLHSTPPGTSIAFLTVFHIIPSTAQVLEPPLHVLLSSMLFRPQHSSQNLHCMSYCLLRHLLHSTAPGTSIAFLTAFYVIPSAADTLPCIAPRVLPQPLLLLPLPSGMSSQMLIPLAPSHLYGFSQELLPAKALLKSKLSPTLSSSSPSLLSCTFKDSCHSRGSLRAGGFYCSVPLGCPLK